MDFKELLSFEHKNMLELLDLLQQEQTFSVLMAAETKGERQNHPLLHSTF